MFSPAAPKTREQASGASKLVPNPSGNHSLQLYMLLTCLRLLRANLAQLMRSGIAQAVLAYTDAVGESSGSSAVPIKAEGCVKELELLKGAVQQVRDVLLSVVDAKHRRNTVLYDDDSSDMAACVSSVAINALMESFEVLIPCHYLQFQFYEHVLRDPTVDDPTMNCWCRSLYHHGLRAGGALLPKSKKLLLTPLLKRLMDDINVVKLMPFSLAASLPCTRSSSVTRPGGSAGAGALRFITSTYQILLCHLAGDFRRQVHQESQLDVADQQALSSATSALRMLQKHITCWALECPSWHRVVQDLERESKPARSMQELVANVIDSTFRVDEAAYDAVPLPWRTMIEFSLAVTSACCQTLVQISAHPPRYSDCRKARNCPSTSISDSINEAEYGRANATALKLVERSLVGQLLPSLLTALFEFTNKPLFAAALLPNMKGLLKLLVAFNRQFSALEEMDKAFIESVVSQFSGGNSGATARGSSTIGSGTDREPIGGLSRNGTARLKQLASSGTGQTANVSDALILPWNYRLEKELAILTSEMVVTLATGEPLAQWTTPAPSGEQPQSCWFFNPLLRGGLNPSLIARSVKANQSHGSSTSAPRRIVTHSPFPTAARNLPSSVSGEFLPFSLILPATSASELESSMSSSIGAQSLVGKAPLDTRKYRRVFSRVTVRKFLLSLATSDSSSGDEWAAAGHRLCEWIKERYAKTDPSYRMLLQLASKARKPIPNEDQREELIRLNDGRIESAAFAVLVHHNALALQAFHFALIRIADGNQPQQTPPPSTFLKLWRFVADLRRQVASKKTAIRSQQHSISAGEAENSTVKNTRDQILDLQRACLERCELLLLVDVRDEEAHVNTERDAGFVGPHNPAYLAAACAEYTVYDTGYGEGLTASVKAHLQARYTDERLPFLVAFPWSKWRLVRVLVHTVSRWKSCCVRSSGIASSNNSGLSSEATLSEISHRVVRFVASSGSVTSSAAVREYLVDPCRRRSCSTRGFEILWELLATVSYDSIRADLVHQVTQALVLRAGDGPLLLVDHHASLQNAGVLYTDLYNNALSDFLMQLTELIVNKAGAAVDAQDCSGLGGFWVLGELLSSWGMRFDADQFEFVSGIGVLPLIHQLLRALPGAELLDAEKTRRAAAPSRTNSLLNGSDRTSYSTDTPRAADVAATKQSRLLHRTLWTIFQSVCEICHTDERLKRVNRAAAR